jgi:hypothetical protein
MCVCVVIFSRTRVTVCQCVCACVCVRGGGGACVRACVCVCVCARARMSVRALHARVCVPVYVRARRAVYAYQCVCMCVPKIFFLLTNSVSSPVVYYILTSFCTASEIMIEKHVTHSSSPTSQIQIPVWVLCTASVWLAGRICAGVIHAVDVRKLGNEIFSYKIK